MSPVNPLAHWVITYGCKLGLEMLCDIQKENWESIPRQGPLIAYTNHSGMLEAPLLYTQLQPRPQLTALAKVESWDNWFLNYVFSLWQIIPIRRGEADMTALRSSLEKLAQGYILGISPEGTRSKDGKLLRAHGGITLLALKANAPLLPIAHWGGEHFGSNVKRLRRSRVHLRVGRPFRLDTGGARVNQDMRQQIADEMMYQIAAMLPEEYRGEYSDLENASAHFLRFA